jgi:hypothetical protein
VSIRHSVVSAMAAALVAGASLAGCSDDSDDPPDSGLPAESEVTEPTSSPTDSEPTEPTGPRPPQLPDAATAPGKAGAKAFVAYYIRLLNYASWTGDTQALRSRAPDCTGCGSYARLYEKTYRNGGWFKGGAWTPIESSWLILTKNPGILIDVKVDSAKGRQLLRRGAQRTRFLADVYQLDFHLSMTAEVWRITRLETPA